jgi:uncharacterized damage-inducible protein DinB
MRRTALILLAIASPLMAQQQQSAPAANASVSAVKANWQSIHNYILRSAEQAPDSIYAFKPAPTVRSLAQLFAHVAGAEKMFCAMITGDAPQAEDEFEKGELTKARMVAALKASGAFCEKAYAISDADAQKMIDVFGRQQTRMYALTMNATHDGEHYGNIITYLRINGLVPPSSQR